MSEGDVTADAPQLAGEVNSDARVAELEAEVARLRMQLTARRRAGPGT